MIFKPLLISLESKAIDEETQFGLDKGVYYGKDEGCNTFGTWRVRGNMLQYYKVLLLFTTAIYESQKSKIYQT